MDNPLDLNAKKGDLVGWVCATCNEPVKKTSIKFECSKCLTEAVMRKDPEDFTKNFAPFVKGECFRCLVPNMDLRVLSICHSTLIRKSSTSKLVTPNAPVPVVNSTSTVVNIAPKKVDTPPPQPPPKTIIKRQSSLFPEMWVPEAKPIDKLCKQICNNWETPQELEKTRSSSIADINEVDDEGRSPLYYAVKLGKLEVVEWLISRGALLDVAIMKKVPLQIAMEYEHYDIIQCLLSNLASPKYVDPNILAKMPRCVRYMLDRATRSKTLRPDARKLAILQSLGLDRLPTLDLALIGQRFASSELNRILPTCKLRRENDLKNQHPLVLLFAGPNSHGKKAMSKELALKLFKHPSKSYLSLHMTAVKDVSQLFTASCGMGSELPATNLGSFLSNSNPREAMIFLEDFDKTSCEVLTDLHLLFESGEYRDSRGIRQYDCSRIVFILSTTALNPVIFELVQGRPNIHQEILSENYETALLFQKTLRKASEQIFGDMMLHVEELIPFFPFSSRDVRILADQLLHKQKAIFAKRLTDNEFRCEEIYLEIMGSSVADVISKDFKDSVGAVSLQRSLDRLVTQVVHEMFIDGKIKRGDRLYVFEQDGKVYITDSMPKTMDSESSFSPTSGNVNPLFGSSGAGNLGKSIEAFLFQK